jgi:cation transport ATPase
VPTSGVLASRSGCESGAVAYLLIRETSAAPSIQTGMAGTDVARESADVVLIGNDLMKFVETVRIARNCRRIIFQNFYGTLIVDTIGIGLAAVGLLNPLLAAFIHVSSELTFILNSTRLLPTREKEGLPQPVPASLGV